MGLQPLAAVLELAAYVEILDFLPREPPGVSAFLQGVPAVVCVGDLLKWKVGQLLDVLGFAVFSRRSRNRSCGSGGAGPDVTLTPSRGGLGRVQRHSLLGQLADLAGSNADGLGHRPVCERHVSSLLPRQTRRKRSDRCQMTPKPHWFNGFDSFLTGVVAQSGDPAHVHHIPNSDFNARAN